MSPASYRAAPPRVAWTTLAHAHIDRQTGSSPARGRRFPGQILDSGRCWSTDRSPRSREAAGRALSRPGRTGAGTPVGSRPVGWTRPERGSYPNRRWPPSARPRTPSNLSGNPATVRHLTTSFAGPCADRSGLLTILPRRCGRTRTRIRHGGALADPCGPCSAGRPHKRPLIKQKSGWSATGTPRLAPAVPLRNAADLASAPTSRSTG